MRSGALCLFFTAILVLSGCSARLPVRVEDGLGAYPTTVSVELAESAANVLSEMYPAGSTVLCVLPDANEAGEPRSSFAVSLESHLRSKGFAVSSDAKRAKILVGYQTDVLLEEGVRVGYWNIITSDGKTFSLSRPLGSVR